MVLFESLSNLIIKSHQQNKHIYKYYKNILDMNNKIVIFENLIFEVEYKNKFFPLKHEPLSWAR